jgi:uncharacterized membrane protein YhhN
MPPKFFYALYALFAFIESFGEWLNLPPSIHLFTKPALMLTLLWYFWQESRGGTLKNKWIFVGAMIFALLGDTFLMFQQQNGLFFMLGLGSFLLMQIGYSVYFNLEIDFKQSILYRRFYVAIPVIIYAIMMYSLLAEKVGDLKPAILAYTLCIATMMLSAINRFGQVEKRSFWWVFFGALAFLISDSVLAVNKFGSVIDHSGLWIMGTYTLAQFLIVVGITKFQSY